MAVVPCLSQHTPDSSCKLQARAAFTEHGCAVTDSRQERGGRHLTSTAWSSYLGLAAVVIWAAVTLALVAAAAARGALAPMGWAPDWALFGGSALESAAQVFAVVPILATAYTCQMTVMFVVRIGPTVDAASQAAHAGPT